MNVQPALALPNGLDVIGIEMIDTVLTITAVSTQMCPCCPLCGTPASRVHSRYTRRLTDLPCGGQQVVNKAKSGSYTLLVKDEFIREVFSLS